MSNIHPGDIIKALITQQPGLSEGALARHTKLKQPTVHRIVNKSVDDPRISNLRAIADYFDVSVGQLLGEVPVNLPRNKKPKQGVFNIPVLGDIVTGPKWPMKPRGKKPQKVSHFVEWPTASQSTYALTVPAKNKYADRYNDRQVLICDPEQDLIAGSTVAVIGKKKNFSLYTYWKEEDGQLSLSPVNKARRTKIKRADALAIHPVVAIIAAYLKKEA